MMRLRARWRAWRLRRRPVVVHLALDPPSPQDLREAERMRATVRRICRPSGAGGVRPGDWPCGEVWERLYGRQA
jgi:hypothetical protein